MSVKYGLIGAGMMGQEHIRNIQLLEGAEVSAIADPNKEMRERACGLAGRQVASFASHCDLLAAGLCDVFIIASPNDTHYSVLRDVVPHNKPILVEKPLCTTAEDCRAIIEFAKGYASPVWVAMEYRYMPPLQRALDEISRGTIGRPAMVSIREHRFPFLNKVGNWNRFNERTGGTMVEKCCHFWDLMRLLAGSNPTRVYASAGMDVNHIDERYNGRRPDIVDNAYAVVDFSNGVRGMLDLCMFAEGSLWQEIVTVVGPHARIEAFVPGQEGRPRGDVAQMSRIEVSERASKRVRVYEVDVDPAILRAGTHYGSTFYEHLRFLDMVLDGRRTPEVSLEDGLWSVLVGEAAEKSAKDGRVVELSDLPNA